MGGSVSCKKFHFKNQLSQVLCVNVKVILNKYLVKNFRFVKTMDNNDNMNGCSSLILYAKSKL